MGGQPAWQGMAPIETPAVNAVLDRPEPVAEEDGAPVNAVMGSSPRRLPVPSLQLLEGGASAYEAMRGAAGRHVLPPELELIRPATAPAAPVNDASARMVEVLQRQHAPAAGGNSWNGGSDRLSFSDLTLVAVAAATQQVAASSGSASASPATQGGSGKEGVGPAGRSQASSPSPEQEHREIEDLARRVLSEVEWLMDAMRDRVGEP
jgi:hypothetical protein